jgi:NAD(P)H-nitrite reductase large subunit
MGLASPTASGTLIESRPGLDREEPMNLDAKVCYCFHVTRRKLLAFLRVEQPRVASQLSQCGGAGTGCGWCIRFLKQLFEQSQQGGGQTELDDLSEAEYARRRSLYVRETGRIPPPGATPVEELPEDEDSA